MLYYDIDTDDINMSKLYSEHIKYKRGLLSREKIIDSFGIDDVLYSYLLREKEMDEFEYKNILQIKNMSLEEVVEYYKLLRQFEFEKGIPIDKGVGFREFLHPFCLDTVKIDGLLKRRKIIVLNDESTVTDKPVLYVSNHIGRFDVEACFEAIKKHAYLFIGDPEDLYKSLAGLLLYANGMIILETDDKIDRFIAQERAIELLKYGKSLLLYPEGAWNLSINQIIMPLYAGAINIALRSGVEIVPMAIEQKGTNFFVNIGKNIDLSNVSMKDKYKYVQELRDILASLRWKIWENFECEKRDNVLITYEEYVNSIMSESEFIYTADDAFKSYYKPKGTSSPEEVFSYMKKLQPNKANAFLLKK